MESFLELLLSLTERSGVIARLIREDKDLFGSLVEEKSGTAKNQRFEVDFKTLSDTLIQELFKHFIGEKFPQLKGFIFGEESNTFTLSNGENVTIEIGPTPVDTAQMLSQLLDSKLAGVLAETIHKEMKIHLKEEDREKVKLLKYLDERQLGVWIDPLDSTNEYVRGVTGSSSDGLYSQSIHCVTTLVGVFDRTTGKPLIGVINQPFHSTDSEGVWCGWSLWGISEESLIGMSSPVTLVRKGEKLNKKICLVSSSEDSSLLDKINASGDWRTINVSGCGYKLLSVITGLADAYVLSKDSSFKWDTCGPHAILLAMEGNLEPFIRQGGGGGEVLYHCRGEGEGSKCWANKDGVIAYVSKDVVSSLLSVID